MEKEVKLQRVYQIIAAISAVGFFISLYSAYLHYNTTAASFCNINAAFNCDAVNRGLYSEIFGVPVSILGMLGYVWMFVLAREMIREPRRKLRLLFAGSIAFAAGFSAHLAWISSELLATWCIVCIASYLCTAAILGIFVWSEL